MSFFQDFIEKVDGQITVTHDLARRVGGDRTRRVSWIPDHQRGLANTLYKPAVRVTKGEGL